MKPEQNHKLCKNCGQDPDKDPVGKAGDLQALFELLQATKTPGQALRRTEDLRPWCALHGRNHATIVNIIRHLTKAGLLERTPRGRRPVFIRLPSKDRGKTWVEVELAWRANSYEHKTSEGWTPGEDDFS